MRAIQTAVPRPRTPPREEDIPTGFLAEFYPSPGRPRGARDLPRQRRPGPPPARPPRCTTQLEFMSRTAAPTASHNGVHQARRLAKAGTTRSGCHVLANMATQRLFSAAGGPKRSNEPAPPCRRHQATPGAAMDPLTQCGRLAPTGVRRSPAPPADEYAAPKRYWPAQPGRLTGQNTAPRPTSPDRRTLLQRLGRPTALARTTAR